MPEIVDARGLSCPQPVLLAMSKMKETESGRIEVMVDSEVSKENITRAAKSQGWDLAEVRKEADEYCLILEKQ